jgi:hypothetical protein
MIASSFEWTSGGPGWSARSGPLPEWSSGPRWSDDHGQSRTS